MLAACPSCTAAVALDQPAEGEWFECPRCKKTFQFRPPQARRVPPPTAPASPAPPGATAPVTAAPAPTAGAAGGPQRFPPKDGPEVELLVLHPSMFRSNPLAFSGLCLAAALGLVLAVYLRIESRPQWAVVACLLGAGVAGLTLLGWWVRVLGSQIRVTSKRLIDRDGLLQRRTSEVLHKDVRNILVTQTLWQRVCNVGTLSIYTAGEGEPEVFMENVPDPARVREIIDRYRPM